MIKRYRPYLEKLGLTYTQYIVLMVAWQEGTISVRDLGRRLHLDSGTLTPVLKHMEQSGLITRRRCSADERVLLVTITEKGMTLRWGCGGDPRKAGRLRQAGQRGNADAAPPAEQDPERGCVSTHEEDVSDEGHSNSIDVSRSF